MKTQHAYGAYIPVKPNTRSAYYVEIKAREAVLYLKANMAMNRKQKVKCAA